MQTIQYVVSGLGTIGLLLTAVTAFGVRRREWRAAQLGIDLAARAHGGEMHPGALDLVMLTTRSRVRECSRPFLLAVPFWLGSIMLPILCQGMVPGVVLPAIFGVTAGLCFAVGRQRSVAPS